MNSLPSILQQNRYVVEKDRFEIFLINGKTLEGKKRDIGWIVDFYNGERWLGTAHAVSLERTIADVMNRNTVNNSVRQIVGYLRDRGLEV